MKARLQSWPLRCHILTLALATIFLSIQCRGQWFWADDWSLIAQRAQGVTSIVRPQSVHWLGLTSPIHLILLEVFGLRWYFPYLAAAILAHILAAHLLWRTMLRIGVTAWWATATLCPFLILGSAWATFLWQENSHEPFSLALAFALLLVVDSPVWKRRTAMLAITLAIAGTINYEVGILFAILGGVIASANKHPRTALRIGVIPIAVYAVWLLLSGELQVSNPGRGHLNQLPLLPDFTWSGLISAIDGIMAVPILSAVALIATATWVWWKRHQLSAPGARVALAAAAAAVAYFGLIAVARLNGGVPWISYYMYVPIGLLLPVLALAVQDLARICLARIADKRLRRLSTATLGIVAAAAATIHSGWLLHDQASAWIPLRQETRISTELAAWTDDPAALSNAEVDPVGGLGVSESELRGAVLEGLVEHPGSASPQALRIEATRLHVEVDATKPLLKYFGALWIHGDPDMSLQRNACVASVRVNGWAQMQVRAISAATFAIRPDTPSFPIISIDDGIDAADTLNTGGMTSSGPGYVVISGTDVHVTVTSSVDFLVCNL